MASPSSSSSLWICPSGYHARLHQPHVVIEPIYCVEAAHARCVGAAHARHVEAAHARRVEAALAQYEGATHALHVEAGHIRRVEIAPVRPSPVVAAPFPAIFGHPTGKSTKRLRKLLACGASSSDSRALRERYEPKFGSSSFQLKAPSLDSSMKRRLIAVRNGNNARSQTTRLNDPMEKSLTEIQLKIMDGIRPLLHLKSELDRLGASRSLKRAASTALSLVGNAFSEFTCLPFGLASAPWAFTKVLKPVVSFLRGKGIKLIVYLDDFLIISSGKSQAEKDFLFTVELLEAVGFVINRAKSSGVPSQSREFLGLVVDSRSLTLSLKKDKVKQMVGSCRKMLSLGKASLWDLSSLIGNFSWAISAVPFAQAHYRSLQHRFLVESRLSDPSAKIPLDIESKSDLAWWRDNLLKVNGKPIRLSSGEFADITIFADASLIGWGAVCDKSTAQGPWTLEEKTLHINHLELIAALYALQCFTARASGVSVLIYSDNSTAVAYINRCGGTWSRSLSATAKSIVEWCEPRRLSLTAVHLAGSRNMVADYQSRVFLDQSDWKLSAISFHQINSRWKMEVDLFAAAWSSQLVKFASWQPQPGAWAVNAFTFSWKNLQKGASGSGASDALLAEPSMVPSCPGAHKRHPGNSASNRSPVDIGHRRDTSADQVEIPHLSRLETLGKRFREQGLSEEVAQLLLDGNRQSTSAAYEAGWALWGDWCRQKHSDPLSNDLNSILQFLSEAFLKGKSYSSVNILRSMLSVTLEQINGKGVGSHPLIIRLMKGIFLNKPPKPRYVATWNVDGALKFVSDLGDNANLSLLDLSKKLVFLLSLSTFARVSELASISRNSVQFSEWGSTFSLSKLRKSQRSGALPVVRVEKFTGDPRLCPVTCMKDYIQATDGLVDGRFGDGLLIASRKPFKPIGASTVARWIKSLLKEAGVDVSTFSAHSTRGAASSKAFNKGLSVETILKTGNWSTESVFSRFYKRVSNSESVVDVVLS
ncbi:Uncharacterized protein APZ42_032312, partial [Daphnia magna]